MSIGDDVIRVVGGAKTGPACKTLSGQCLHDCSAALQWPCSQVAFSIQGYHGTTVQLAFSENMQLHRIHCCSIQYLGVWHHLVCESSLAACQLQQTFSTECPKGGAGPRCHGTPMRMSGQEQSLACNFVLTKRAAQHLVARRAQEPNYTIGSACAGCRVAADADILYTDGMKVWLACQTIHSTGLNCPFGSALRSS